MTINVNAQFVNVVNGIGLRSVHFSVGVSHTSVHLRCRLLEDTGGRASPGKGGDCSSLS